MSPVIECVLEAANSSLQSLRGRVTDVVSGFSHNGEKETIKFLFDGIPYIGLVDGAFAVEFYRKGYILGISDEFDTRIAIKMILDGIAIPRFDSCGMTRLK